MTSWSDDCPGAQALLMGNEAIARGALEAGVRVAAAYPGNPSSEIIATLATLPPDAVHVEWSTNEKVALEVAAAASLCGLRALAAMKQNGLNVACDFLLNLNLTGCRGGLVVVVCDDPGGLSSTNEQDSRAFAAMGDLPLLEPGSVDEARRMTCWAFELSEQLGLPVLVRSVTRISHARASVALGMLPSPSGAPSFDTTSLWVSVPPVPAHRKLHDKLRDAEQRMSQSPFNRASGPPRPALLVIAMGAARSYAAEAIAELGLGAQVALLELGTTWPLPRTVVSPLLASAPAVLVLEDVDPFVEHGLEAMVARSGPELRPVFHGRGTGAVPDVGELTPDRVRDALVALLGPGPERRPSAYAEQARAVSARAPQRALGFCPGCPHRASYWLLKQALGRDGRNGFVLGDIGCYGLGFTPSGFGQMRTMQAMGSGTGMACGMGALHELGLRQPAVAVCGDSTFFHAALPALVNARYNQALLRVVVLDNEATAMTGFQPHPGTGKGAQGRAAQRVPIEQACCGLGLQVAVCDPFDQRGASEALDRLLEQRSGQHVLILRQPCALLRQALPPSQRRRLVVDEARCVGERCGCNRMCTRVFRCPGLLWDASNGVARVDAALCTGCGVCTAVCPTSALTVEVPPC